MRDFFFPDELMYLYPDDVNHCSFSFIMCMPSVSGKQPLGMGFGPNLGWELGFGIPPLQDPLIILLLSYISTRTVVQIVQFLITVIRFFNVLLTGELNFL